MTLYYNIGRALSYLCDKKYSYSYNNDCIDIFINYYLDNNNISFIEDNNIANYLHENKNTNNKVRKLYHNKLDNIINGEYYDKNIINVIIDFVY